MSPSLASLPTPQLRSIHSIQTFCKPSQNLIVLPISNPMHAQFAICTCKACLWLVSLSGILACTLALVVVDTSNSIWIFLPIACGFERTCSNILLESQHPPTGLIHLLHLCNLTLAFHDSSSICHLLPSTLHSDLQGQSSIHVIAVIWPIFVFLKLQLLLVFFLLKEIWLWICRSYFFISL